MQDQDSSQDATGTERMYGLGRVLADFYDSLPVGTIITAAIQQQAQQVARAWLASRLPVAPEPYGDEQDAPPGDAAHG